MSGVRRNVSGCYHPRPSADCTLMSARHQSHWHHGWLFSPSGQATSEESGGRIQTDGTCSCWTAQSVCILCWGKKQHDVMGRDDKVAAFKTESGLPRAQCASQPEILEERSHWVSRKKPDPPPFANVYPARRFASFLCAAVCRYWAAPRPRPTISSCI